MLKRDHEHIQHGPYAYIRHQIYSGLLLMFFGAAIWFGTIAWFLLFIAVFFGFQFKAKQEEKLHAKHCPTAYPKYMKRTKALIPLLL